MEHNAIKDKWDMRYRACRGIRSNISAVLQRNAHLLPQQGQALDLACGLGANALFLAQRGLEVEAWDISPVAIKQLSNTARESGITLHTQCRDVVLAPPSASSFDIIVVSRFLERTLCPAITRALKPGGLLFYQTYLSNRKNPAGPSNPQFLLETDELMTLFNGLERLFYEEADEALLVARNTRSSNAIRR